MSGSEQHRASALTTEMVMVGALERGLTLRDFEVLTVGMISDYISTYNDIMGRANATDVGNKGTARMAGQNDFDRF